VDFKISTLVYRSLTGTAPVYLDDECTLITAADLCGLLTIKHAWPRDHATSLPEQLREPDITFGQLKRSLKTFMSG